MIISRTIADENINLFRIMPLERFLQMLYTMQSVLVHPSAWDDPYERIVQKSLLYVKNLGTKTYRFFDDKLWFGQCWSYNQESDALWRVFSNAKLSRSVKIKTTSDLLKASLSRISQNKILFLEKVQYAKQAEGEDNIRKVISDCIKNYWLRGIPNYGDLLKNDIFRDDTQVEAVPMLLTKRKCFESEHEVRLILYSQEQLKEDVFCYDIPEMGRFIEEVELDPWTPKGVGNVIRDIVRHYIPGVNIPVYTSGLYKPIDHGLYYAINHSDISL